MHPFFKDYCTFENKFRQVQFLQLGLQFNKLEDGTPTKTTSIKNVGLSEPKRSGVEHTPAVSVNLSLQQLIVVNWADSTQVK